MSTKRHRQVLRSLADELFPDESVTSILAILDDYGHENRETEQYRVQVAALLLSEGDAQKLMSYIELAKRDHHDFLCWVEFLIGDEVHAYRTDALSY